MGYIRRANEKEVKVSKTGNGALYHGGVCVKTNRTPNYIRLCIYKQDNYDTMFQKYDWELVNKFGMEAGQADVSEKNRSMLVLDVDPVTATYEGLWN